MTSLPLGGYRRSRKRLPKPARHLCDMHLSLFGKGLRPGQIIPHCIERLCEYASPYA